MLNSPIETIIVKSKNTNTTLTPRERILDATEKRLESAPKRQKVRRVESTPEIHTLSRQCWPSEKADPLKWD